MATDREKGHLMFDGDCGVCTWASRFATRIDRKKGAFQIRPFQDYSEHELQPHEIDRKKLAARLHVITPRGKVRTGAFAINAFLLAHFPWSILAVVIYLLAPLLLLEVLAYWLISRRRHRISRWLGLTACAVDRPRMHSGQPGPHGGRDEPISP